MEPKESKTRMGSTVTFIWQIWMKGCTPTGNVTDNYIVQFNDKFIEQRNSVKMEESIVGGGEIKQVEHSNTKNKPLQGIKTFFVSSPGENENISSGLFSHWKVFFEQQPRNIRVSFIGSNPGWKDGALGRVWSMQPNMHTSWQNSR